MIKDQHCLFFNLLSLFFIPKRKFVVSKNKKIRNKRQWTTIKNTKWKHKNSYSHILKATCDRDKWMCLVVLLCPAGQSCRCKLCLQLCYTPEANECSDFTAGLTYGTYGRTDRLQWWNCLHLVSSPVGFTIQHSCPRFLYSGDCYCLLLQVSSGQGVVTTCPTVWLSLKHSWTNQNGPRGYQQGDH